MNKKRLKYILMGGVLILSLTGCVKIQVALLLRI